MGEIKIHNPVKLIIGLIFRQQDSAQTTIHILKKAFGAVDYESPVVAFTHTAYYEKEFGTGLMRRFISFKKLIRPEDLPKIKRLTNRIEKKLSKKNCRTINIDPGYLDLAKLVLATTKNYRHRIYLGNGIYAEITLYYQKSGFTPWPWTYPDYRNCEYIRIFNHIRDVYAEQLTKN